MSIESTSGVTAMIRIATSAQYLQDICPLVVLNVENEKKWEVIPNTIREMTRQTSEALPCHGSSRRVEPWKVDSLVGSNSVPHSGHRGVVSPLSG